MNFYFFAKRIADVFLNCGVLYFVAWTIGPTIGIKVETLPLGALHSAGWAMLIGCVVVSAGIDALAEKIKP